MGAHSLAFVTKKELKEMQWSTLKFAKTNISYPLLPRGRNLFLHLQNVERWVTHVGLREMAADRRAFFQTMRYSCNGC